MKLPLVMFTAIMAATTMLAPAHADPRKRGDDLAKGDPNRIICRSEESTGSRLGSTKRCLTAFEWLQIKQQNQRDLEKIQQGRFKNE